MQTQLGKPRSILILGQALALLLSSVTEAKTHPLPEEKDYDFSRTIWKGNQPFRKNYFMGCKIMSYHQESNGRWKAISVTQTFDYPQKCNAYNDQFARQGILLHQAAVSGDDFRRYLSETRMKAETAWLSITDPIHPSSEAYRVLIEQRRKEQIAAYKAHLKWREEKARDRRLHKEFIAEIKKYGTPRKKLDPMPMPRPDLFSGQALAEANEAETSSAPARN